jgi:hypothetical protein
VVLAGHQGLRISQLPLPLERIAGESMRIGTRATCRYF